MIIDIIIIIIKYLGNKMKTTKLSLVLTSLLTLTPALVADDTADIKELKQQVKELQEMAQILTDETSDLKTGFNYTTVDNEKSFSGLGAAASKVYYSSSPLSIGGYGEMYASHTNKEIGASQKLVDVYRFVPYIGYKFTDNIILNTEIEFEHGGVTPDEGGEVIVEFMYLDFLINKNINFRVGNFLVPMGLINERHEPTLFNTVQRPATSKYLIPSTWHESGMMVYGNIIEGLEYKLALITALTPGDSGKKWIRDGRGGSFKNKDPKASGVARVDYTKISGLMVGVSFYTDRDVLMADAHIDYKYEGARVYGVYTQTTRSDTTASQVKKATGGYINASFDILSLTSFDTQLPLFVQYESTDPEAKFGNAKSGESTNTVTLGLNYFPHPQVVLKTDYAMAKNFYGDEDVLSVSMGFIF